MEEDNIDKTKRVLIIYTKHINGAIVNKTEEALINNCNERSIQCDIDDVRNYLELQGVEEGLISTVVYDREKKRYLLEQLYKMKFTNAEILAICKGFIDFRAFSKNEWNAYTINRYMFSD